LTNSFKRRTLPQVVVVVVVVVVVIIIIIIIIPHINAKKATVIRKVTSLFLSLSN